MRASPDYSRRRFLHAGAAGAAATVVAAATTPVRAAAEAGTQPLPSTATAPRILRKPPLPELERIAKSYNLALSRDDLTSFRNLMDGVLASYRRLDQFAEPTLAVKYPREAGFRPPASDNRLNAWYWRCSIKGATSGPLAGKKIAIKDNVCVAGIPMMNGSNVLEGYVPDVDATIVARILDAGGEIVGKSVCEHLCFSGGSHTSDTGPVLNPHDPKRSAGGSSSGSAALVVAAECDMAIGGDQGGSIRIPSSFCGAVGHKPTHGLVPYTGVFPIELTLDHTGPIAVPPAMPPGFSRCSPEPMASTRANRRDCVRKPIPSNSPETPAACGSVSSRKGLAGPIPSPMSMPWCARRHSG